MPDQKVVIAALVGLIGLFASTSAASAEDRPQPAVALIVAPPMSDDSLQAVSAGQSPTTIALTNQNLTAINTGNLITANSVTTGQVAFASGALQGFTGIGNFVINTGNNNNLQGSLSVTVIPLP